MVFESAGPCQLSWHHFSFLASVSLLGGGHAGGAQGLILALTCGTTRASRTGGSNLPEPHCPLSLLWAFTFYLDLGFRATPGVLKALQSRITPPPWGWGHHMGHWGPRGWLPVRQTPCPHYYCSGSPISFLKQALCQKEQQLTDMDTEPYVVGTGP